MSSLASSRWTTVAAVAVVLSIAATTLFTWPASALELSGDPVVVRQLATEQALLALTNADRAQNGLPALDFDPETLAIARARADRQLHEANLSHYDEHGLLAFVRLLDDASLKYGLAGENLARSRDAAAGIEARIEAALMKSPTHRKNILEPRFTQAAIGVAQDGPTGEIAFAEIFRD